MQRFKWISDELANSRKALDTLNKTAVLADIFWDKIQTKLDNKNNTDIALQVYEEQILKGNWFVLSEIEAQIENSSWELQYNLIRIREKFDEMRDVFEREIDPVIKQITYWFRKMHFDERDNYLDKITNNDSLHELTKLIIRKYNR